MDSVFQLLSDSTDLILGSSPTEESLPTYKIIVNSIMIAIYAIVEVWCIYAMLLTFKSKERLQDLSLVLFYTTFHLTLTIRVINYIGDTYCTYSHALTAIVRYSIVLSKDMLAATLTARILEAVKSVKYSSANDKLIKGLYCLMLVHTIAIVVMLLVNNVKIDIQKYISSYIYAVEVIILGLYIWSFIAFLMMREIIDKEARDSPIMKWLFILVLYMMMQFIFRLVNNILYATKLLDKIDNDNHEVYFAYSTALNIISEVIACTLMAVYLYTITKEDTEQEKEHDSIVVRSSF